MAMAIKLKDLLQKAEEKGYSPIETTIKKEVIDKPWKYGSILFNPNTISSAENHKNITVTPHKLNTDYINKKSEEYKPSTNQTQTKHKLDTNQAQTRHKPSTNQTQTKYKPDTSLDTIPDTNQTQTRHKPDSKKLSSKFTELSGNEREILIALYKNCKKNRHEITDPLTITHIIDISKVTPGSI